MAYDSRLVANYLLEKSNFTLDPMKLLKLAYIAHGWMLGLYGRPLLADDVEAWRYGPVVRQLYREVRTVGHAPVAHRLIVPETQSAEFDADARSVIDEVYELYGHLDGLKLSSLTHKRNTPWDRTWKTFGQSAIIPQDWIAEHYRALAHAQ